jgi:hypothetical protein
MPRIIMTIIPLLLIHGLAGGGLLTLPLIEQLPLPESEIRDDIDVSVVATMIFELKITRDGKVVEIKLADSWQIPPERIDEFFAFFKDRIPKAKITPGTEDGKPIPMGFKYPVQWDIFVPRSPVKSAVTSSSNSSLTGAPLLSSPAEISSVSPSTNQNNLHDGEMILPDGRTVVVDEYRLELLEKATRILGVKEPRVQKSKTAILVSPPGNPIQANYLFSSIEATQTTMMRVFEQLLPPTLQLRPVIAYLFDDLEKYHEFIKDMAVDSWSHGTYFRTLGLIAAYHNPDSLRITRESLIHETAHSFMEEIVFSHGSAPRWFGEGLAKYFEGSLITNDGIMHPGVIEHVREQANTKDAQKTREVAGFADLDYILIRRKKLEGHLVADLVTCRIVVGPDSTPEQIRLFYCAGFALVNCLLGTERTGFNQEFFTFIKALAEGKDSTESFASSFGSFDSVEERLWIHLKKL